MKRLPFYRSAVLLAVCALSTSYVMSFVQRGWVPHDEGYFAQTAERLLGGELPHRDFAEMYTGGLTYLHALAFKLFGLRLTSMRIVLLIFFLAFVPAIYAIALRAASPIVAGLIVMLSVVWSIPNYFASVPSWYNLFFASFGTLALLRFIDTNYLLWLFIAGLCGGLSFLVKLSGIYYLCAVLLFLVYWEQCNLDQPRSKSGVRSYAFPLFKTVCLFLFSGVLVLLVHRFWSLSILLHFVLPGISICSYLAWTEWRNESGLFAARVRSLFRLMLPFGAGFVIPLLLFSIPYFLGNGLRDLYRGVFVLPGLHLKFATYPMPGALTILATLPYAALVSSRLFSRERRKEYSIPLLLFLYSFLLFAPQWSFSYPFVWWSISLVVPVITILGCMLLSRGNHTGLSKKRRLEVFLLISLAAMVSLIRYPFGAPIYFCYVAPIAILALHYLLSDESHTVNYFQLAVHIFYLLFAIFWVNPGFIYNLGVAYATVDFKTPLAIERAGIYVSETDARVYKALVDEINRHEVAGASIYAAPDCPEVYFLAKMKNSTRFLFHFYDEPEKQSDRILRVLEKEFVRVVVINRLPKFSLPFDRELEASLQSRFPGAIQIGWFTVRWRD